MSLITNWMFETKGIKDIINEPNEDGLKDKEICLRATNALIPQLKDIKKKIIASNLKPIDIEYFGDLLDETIDNFEFIIFLDGKEDEWNNYDFDGNWSEIFNDYLNDLYDLGDYKPEDKMEIFEN